jgi:hypothetical protein
MSPELSQQFPEKARTVLRWLKEAIIMDGTVLEIQVLSAKADSILSAPANSGRVVYWEQSKFTKDGWRKVTLTCDTGNPGDIQNLRKLRERLHFALNHRFRNPELVERVRTDIRRMVEAKI